MAPFSAVSAGGPARNGGGSDGGVVGKRKDAGSPLESQPSQPSFTPVNPPGQSQVSTAANPTGANKKVKVEKAQRDEYYKIPALANTTPFITKLKFIVDNPSEFGDAIRWE